MRAYIIEYRQHLPGAGEIPSSSISQEGYATLEAAQAFIERKPGAPVAVTPMLYQTAEGSEQYIIHDVLILNEQPAPRANPYESTRAAVAATGNRWAMENFKATHG